MRKQQLTLGALGLATALSIGSAYAGDDPPGSSPGGKAKPAAADAHQEKGEHGKPGHGRPDHAADPAGKGADAATGPGKDKGPAKHDDAAKDKEPSGRGPGRGGMRELWTELKSGKLKHADLKERLGELRERRDERAKLHREELKARFGATLATPPAKQELEHHARRMAKLNRAMVLVETEVTKDKDKLKERIQKLIDKENARHQQAMERIKSNAPPGAAAANAPGAAAPNTPPGAAAPNAPPGAAAAGSAVPGAATPPAAVAVEKGAEK